MPSPDYLAQALAQYDLPEANVTFIRHNENITYQIKAGGHTYLLRIHKPVEHFSPGILVPLDSSKRALVQGELLLLSHLATAGFPAQRPVSNTNGDLLSILPDGTPATLLTWILGSTLDAKTITLPLAHDLGQMIGALHTALHSLHTATVCRYRYDTSVLDQIEAEISRAAAMAHITQSDASIIYSTSNAIRKTMLRLDSVPQATGLSHADLSASNMLLTDSGIVPIDFSLSGYGYRPMDIGMVFSQYPQTDIQHSILQGYRSVIDIELCVQDIQSFYVLSILLFIASQHGRFYAEDWFPANIRRWCDTLFVPLIQEKQFILL